MKVYLAGGWFTQESSDHLEHIRHVLRQNKIEFFDPQNDNLFKPGMSPKEVVKGNIKAIYECDAMVACVDRFKRDRKMADNAIMQLYEVDVGTSVEVGIALAKNIPIVYVWFYGMPGEKFNLMLGATGAVAKNTEQLIVALESIHNFSESTVDDNDLE